MSARKPSPSKKRSQRVVQSTSKVKAAYRFEMRKNSKILFIVLAVLIGIGFLIQGIVWFNQYNEATDGQKKIEAYLEEKYDQDFVVERPTHEGYGFAIEGVLKAVAYPSRDPDLRFRAEISSGYTRDDYITVLWTDDATRYAAPIIEQIYGRNADYDVRVSTPTGNKAKTLDLSLKDALASSSVALTVTIRNENEIDPAEKRVIAERVYTLGQKLQQNGTPIFYIYYYGGQTSILSYSHTKKGASAGSVDELIRNIKGVR